jgi:ABC-type multidrug transport system fused ATPase/permease subunit
VRVDQLAVTLGGTISGPFVTVSGSEIALRMQVQESDAARLTVGDTVFVDEDILEEPLEGVISSIAERGTGGRVAVEVVLETVPEELVGANVKVVIPIESTAGEVLAVPAAALSAVADGSVRSRWRTSLASPGSSPSRPGSPQEAWWRSRRLTGRSNRVRGWWWVRPMAAPAIPAKRRTTSPPRPQRRPPMATPDPPTDAPVVHLMAVARTYQAGAVDVPALKEATLRIDRGEYVSIVGPSGSGKSTLLNIIGLLTGPPTAPTCSREPTSAP